MNSRTLNFLPAFYIGALLLALFCRMVGSIGLFRAIHRFESKLQLQTYKYVGADVPRELPGEYPDVGLVFNKDDIHYPWNDNKPWTTLFPNDLGLIRLGPKGRPYGISFYHQLHCLDSIRYVYMITRLGLAPDATYFTAMGHTAHCFHMIRQSILCNADLTLIPVDEDNNNVQNEELHRCRDWTKIRNFVEENQAEWKEVDFEHAWEDVDEN